MNWQWVVGKSGGRFSHGIGDDDNNGGGKDIDRDKEWFWGEIK